MEFRHLQEVLQRYGELLCTRYQSYVPEATGRLASTARFEVVYKDTTYEVGLWLQDYWKYVENGRKPGKWPPLSKIEEWIRVKPVIPRPNKNGTLPTEKQLAFLIGRKIYGFITRNGKKIPIDSGGIKPRPLLQQTIDEVNDNMLMSIKMAIMEDIQEDFESVLVLLGNKQ